jgi:fatty-acid desaturase
MSEDDSAKECCCSHLTWKQATYIIGVLNVLGFLGTAVGTVLSVFALLESIAFITIVALAYIGCLCVLVFFPRAIAFWRMYKAQDEQEMRLSNHKANLVTTVFYAFIMIGQAVGMIIAVPSSIISYLIFGAASVIVGGLIQIYFIFCLGRFAGLYGDVTSLKDGFKGVKEGLVDSTKNTNP